MQLASLRKFIRERLHIKYIFCDYPCLAQGKRTPTDKAEFQRMLANINMLYLGATVLIQLDRSYLQRFWVCMLRLPCRRGG